MPSFRRNPRSSVSYGIAVRDLVAGLYQWQRWLTLGNREIIHRYRRSMLGPFWITLSTAVTVVALSLIYSRVLRMPLAGYAPYVATGLVIWSFISGTILEGSQIFIDRGMIVQQVPAPLSTYAYRALWQNFLIMLHNSVIAVLALILWRESVSPVMLLVVPAFALLCLNLAWIVLLCAMASARFRDVQRLIAQFIQLALFATPVFWRFPPDVLLMKIMAWNPFYYMVELIRRPLLGEGPPEMMWLVGGLAALGGWLATLAVFARYRWRIAYWL